VVFDAWRKAVAQNGILIADTAGRMHTKQPLVEELKKVIRVLQKDGSGAPHECYLVLDGTTGQNALAQSREFLKAAPLTGLIVTKLDGSARGGAALSSSLELSLPIRYLGVGEKPEDLIPFEPAEFAGELFRE
jgi:fused signal recognition particle receptor